MHAVISIFRPHFPDRCAPLSTKIFNDDMICSLQKKIIKIFFLNFLMKIYDAIKFIDAPQSKFNSGYLLWDLQAIIAGIVQFQTI